MQTNVKIGIALMVLGVGVWVAWKGWTGTRKTDPVDLPVLVAAGQSVVESLQLNYDGLYLIEITADNQGATEALAGVEADWSVWSGGREVSQATTGETHSAPARSRGITKVLGEFNGRAGQRFELRVQFKTDAPELQSAKPRLRVAVSGLAKENLDAASVLLFSIVFICEFFGLVLVGIGTWAKTQRASGDASG